MKGRTYCANLGDGTYLNPILNGNYPDPSILKDGEDYYMLNCFQERMWHSMDLIHWQPIYDFPYPMGGASELQKVDDIYYVYNIGPYKRDENDYKSSSVWVTTTNDITSGNWTEPSFVGPAFNLENDRELVDPGLIVDFEGKRWLYMSDNICFPLTDDGMKFAGPGKRVLEDEKFPDDWEIQGTYTEGPRLIKKGEWIYLTLAAGGTEGPPTSHGIFLYRSKNANGPWERCPYNPIMRTLNRNDEFLSRGHGMPVEAPDGSWYIAYHGLRNGRYNQGRMFLLEPIEWTDDGWYRIPEWSSSNKPLPMPKGGKVITHGYPTHIEFPRKDALPGEWYYIGDVKNRITEASDGIRIMGNGTSLHNTGGVLCYGSVFKNFEIITEVTVGNGAGAGIAMYYNSTHSVGFALKDDWTWVFNCEHFNLTRRYNGVQYLWDHAFLKLTVRHQIVSCWISPDGENYTKLIPSFNIRYINFLAHIPCETPTHMMMLPALFTYGNGEAVFHNFTINELNLND